MKAALGVLVVVTAISAAHVNYVAPVASGYIYRSDNNGPPSLIQLGAVPYQQPHAFAPPLPLAQPLKLEAIEAYDLEPATLPYVAAKPIVVEDIEEDDDDSDESSEEYLDSGDLVGLDHGHAHEKGAGSEYSEENHAANGEKGSKGYNSKGHHAKAESGHYDKEHNEGYSSEADGEKKGHHDEVDVHGKHYEAGNSYKGGDNGHKKHFSKGEDITGYHKVFHKDEFKKDHDFYDVADNSGHFKKHAYENEEHGAKKGGHKEDGHHDAGLDKGSYGKAGFHAKAHVDEAELAHSAEEGHESDYKHQEDFGKKGDSGHEKEYAYIDDDDEDED